MKSVIITGTSKGLGKALLEEFLSNGWLVYALARDISTLECLSERYKGNCIPIQADITNEHSTELINNAILSNTKSLDILINNAGNADKCFGLENVSPNDLENHFNVHVSGTFRIIKACLPFLQRINNSIIINVSSRKGSISKINSGEFRILLPYQIAKAAQNMLTVGLSQELRKSNVRIYAIHPGNLKTDVAPPDADTEPSISAEEIYKWVSSNPDLASGSFYSIMDKTILDW